MTACHNPACTVQTIDETGVTLFAGARDANRILELPRRPAPGPSPEALRKPPRDYAAAAMCGVVLAMTAPSGTKPVST